MTHNASAQGQPDFQDGFSTESNPMPPQNAGWGVDMRDRPELSNKIREKGTYKGVSYDYRIETPHGTFYGQDSPIENGVVGKTKIFFNESCR